MPPTINDYYREAIRVIEQEVEETADVDVAYFIDRHGMVPIEIDASRNEQLVEVGSVSKTTDVRMEVPVVSSDTLKTIESEKLAPMPFSLGFEYPPFKYDHGRGVVYIVARATEEATKHARDAIHTNIDRYNGNITEQNEQFPAEVERIITAKKERLATKNKNLDELSVKLGIPLVKKG